METAHQPSRPTLAASLDGTRTSSRWSEVPGSFDAVNARAIFASSNEWGIPDLPPADLQPGRLLAYSSRTETDRARPGDAVHFFLDDYRFEVVWAKPERGLSRLQRVGAALTPDFSLWRDMPLAVQVWQVYRSRWCGAWMAHHGVQVIPTVTWSTPDTHRFAFAGIAPGSVVAISTVGVRDKTAKQLFAAGFAALVEAVRPPVVLVYGAAPTEQVAADQPIHRYPTRWER